MSTAPGSFYVGGHYVETADGDRRMAGQAYVQHVVPTAVTQPYPIVMIHGANQTAVNFEVTADGRPGWASDFVAAGYEVFLLEHPGRGRSGYLAESYGEAAPPRSVEHHEHMNTASREYALWPAAERHSQWPGSGHPGDAAFDQFYASQVHSISDPQIRERTMRDAGAALLDTIGPAYLLTHSQGGQLGWQVADSRPDLVKAIIAVEPGGPPFYDMVPVGAPQWFEVRNIVRPWGLTSTPLAYDPWVADPLVDLVPAAVPSGDDPRSFAGWLQTEPARRLTNLARIHILVLTADASYHRTFDHCTVQFLRQGGATVDHIYLADRGITGNGHMMMLERNSSAIARIAQDWLATQPADLRMADET